MGISFCHVLRSHPFFTVDNAQDINIDTVEMLDPTNVADADAFKELTRSINQPSAMVIDHPADNSLADVPEEHGPQTN